MSQGSRASTLKPNESDSSYHSETRTVTMPNGEVIEFTKPWHEYDVEELNALGLMPDMPMGGASSTVSWFVPRGPE